MNRRTIFALCAACLSVFTPVSSTAGDFPKGSPDFERSYAAALKKAKESGKPLVVVFSATWCPPCQSNKKNVYPSEPVKVFHDKFIWAYLDTDDETSAKTAKEFGVSGIPHIQFVDKDGKSIDKMVGGSSPEEFAKTLTGILAKIKGATSAGK